MSNQYTEAELDAAKLRLINAIPEEDHGSCRPFRGLGWQSPWECNASDAVGYKEIAEELALRDIVAERLLDEFENLPTYEETDEGLQRLTDEQRHIGDCMLRRALGVCPVAEGVKNV